MEDWRKQVTMLLLSVYSIYKSDNESEEYVKKDGSILRIDTEVLDIELGDEFVFNPLVFANDEPATIRYEYRNGFILLNKLKTKAYLKAFRDKISRINNGLCTISINYVPEDDSFWIVKSKKTNECKTKQGGSNR